MAFVHFHGPYMTDSIVCIASPMSHLTAHVQGVTSIQCHQHAHGNMNMHRNTFRCNFFCTHLHTQPLSFVFDPTQTLWSRLSSTEGGVRSTTCKHAHGLALPNKMQHTIVVGETIIFTLVPLTYLKHGLAVPGKIQHARVQSKTLY